MTRKRKSNENKNNSDSENQRIEYEYCKVCKLNHNDGRRHNYFPNHKKALSSFLSRFQAKLKNDVDRYVNDPIPLHPEHHSRNGLWCVFCECDILESSSSFARGNAIQHLASAEHLKQVKGFLWRYGGGMDCLNSFRIMESDFAKWDKKCKLLRTEVAGEGSRGLSIGPSNDIQTEMKSNCLERFEKNNSLNSLHFDIKFPNGVVPLQNHTNERSQMFHSEISRVTVDGPHVHGAYVAADNGVNAWAPETISGAFGDRHFHIAPHEHPLVNGRVYPYERIPIGEGSSQGTLTGEFCPQGALSASVQQDSGGNVHSGAPPPWLSETEIVQLEKMSNRGQSHQVSSLGKSAAAKSSRLNPKRVGAAWAERRKIELEMQKRGELANNSFDADWLPNFGRVWQSGSRKESKREFMGESKSLGKANTQMDSTNQLQPYISKIMRGDTSS